MNKIEGTAKKKIVNPITRRRIEDLTGQKFNKLTVLGLDIERMKEEFYIGREKAKIYWFVECECGSGKPQSVHGTALKCGTTCSCGCSLLAINREIKFRDLTGEKFGRLKVISINEEVSLEKRLKGERNRYWNCKCDCGNEENVVISGRNLKRGGTMSCGCLASELRRLRWEKKALSGNSVAHYIEEMYGKECLYDIWDKDRNGDLDPYKINKGSEIKFYAKCENDYKHGSYPVMISNFTSKGSRCPTCSESKGEKRVRKWLEENNYNFKSQKEFEGLIGLSGGNLSYDFYLLDYNLLIEFQGEFHDGKGNYYMKENLEKQKEHDRRKKEYAKLHNIELFEIWYWDFDNVEDILLNKLIINPQQDASELDLNDGMFY